MEATFNPYLKWLGIPLKHQPPTHYRLLGVELFEGDADIIERAADRQMTYLRSLQAGDHAQAAQQLLNEIATAKVCLLDAKRKTEYDERLRAKTQEQDLRPKPAPALANGSGIHAATPPPARRAAPSEVRTAQPLGKSGGNGAANGAAPIVAINTGAAGVATARAAAPGAPAHASPGKSTLPLVIGAIAAGAFLILSLGIAAVAFMSGGDSDEVVQTASSGNENAAVDGSTLPATNDSTTSTSTTDGIAGGDQDTTLVGDTPEEPENNPPTHKPPAAIDHPRPPRHGTRPKRIPLAVVELDAPFLLGTLDDGEAVLSDREFTFANVAAELQGLDFTRWQYGPVAPLKIKPERKGEIYLLVPPNQYSRTLPSVNMPDWEETSLRCDVDVGGGQVLACQVLRYSGAPRKEIAVATSASLWPIVAVGKINKRTRILADIVDSDTPQPGPPTVKPPVDKPPTVKPPIGVKPPADPPPAQTAKKLKVPASDVQKPIRERLAEIYDIEGSKTPEEKLAAAKNLLEVAREPSEKPEERYVMLATSAQLAADGGDLTSALLAVETIGVDFEADLTAMRLHLARLFAKSSVNRNLKSPQLAQVLPIIDEGLANDHFDAIDELVTELLAAKLTHPELAGRRKIALDMKDTYRKVTAARKTLATSSDDPAANRVVGEYLCYYKLDWEQGLPHLAKADDAAIKAVAGRDAAKPESGTDLLAVADGWFDIAKELEAKTDERQKGSLLVRAQEHYERAVANLKGLDEAHAKKRLDEVQSELVKMGWVDVPREAVIVATSGYGFECYLNGQRLFDGSYEVASTTTTLKRGDVLMFQARKGVSSYGNYAKGFACVIAFKGAPTVATGLSKGWEGYIPADRFEWYKPDGVAERIAILASTGEGHRDLIAQTGVGARSIWPAIGGSEGYFFYRVK